MLNLAEYRDALKLDDEWPAPAASKRTDRELFEVAFGGLEGNLAKMTDRELFTELNHRLIQRDPEAISEDVSRAIDVLLYRLSGYLGRTEARHLARISDMMPESEYPARDKTVIWRGDARELVVDAVVNGARPNLLGYRDYNKPSIDQAIHGQAGPWLRNDCATLYSMSDRELEPGEAALTRGYRLPARYVLHTLPPTVEGEVTDADRAALASCYTRCLDLASEKGDITSVSFCSLATGHSHFPFAEATRIALDTVAQWLHQNPRSNVNLVVFDIFADEDAEHFVRTIERWVEE
ncbi:MULTISPECIES: macro domain-containing protein [Actinotignum]|uniref:macro domain-containing protein n=1 Tax=Actinotignum TaxID=1653174 RepID=UPI000422ECE9|nr:MULTISPECIES: macro domain-containing protein [Actinotignum]AIE83015.1 Appr-1-p processing protein [Actinotignum schaalii]MDE1535870.1 macro domain-containing protein [Actinotignum schaalii]MDK7271638.1 macro domain-containing protein [Actinotignum schaalii]MDY5144246.1 macro domain-containing protein [Actinotignum timonense]WQN45166.1 macro domain-containing protein [Actinotignum schaalii]